MSAAVPDGKGDFSLFSAKDDVASLRLVVGSDPVKTIRLPADPTKVVLTLPRRVKRTPAKSPGAMLNMKATRRWIARLERLGRKWPKAAETAAVATRIADTARAAAEHDLDALSAGVLAGQPGAALELDRILSTVPPPGAPSAPRVTGGEPAAWPTLALDAILDPNRPADTSPSPDKRKLSKAHARLLVAAAVAGRGNDRDLLRNAVAALRLVHDLRVLQLLGSATGRMGGDNTAYREPTHTARAYEYAGRSSELYGSPAPVSLVEPTPPGDIRPLIWDLPEFRDFSDVVRAARNAEITAGPHDERIVFDPPRACEGQPVTIRHDFGAWAGRTITGVRFSSRRHVASLPAGFMVVDDEIVVEQVPVGSVSGPVAIDITPGDLSFEWRGIQVNLEPGGTSYARFLGGMTALFLVRMRPRESWRSGLVAGTEIDVRWEASNVEEVRGEVVGADTTVRFRAEAAAGEVLTPVGHHRVRLADSTHRHEVRCTLTGRGPCGDATPVGISARVCRSERLLRGREDPALFENVGFANWHYNIRRPEARVATPGSIDELIRAVRTAERDRVRLGVKGKGCSYTDVVFPAPRQRIVDLWRLRTTSVREIEDQCDVLRTALRDDVTSVLEADVRSAYWRHTHLRSRPVLTDVRDRLVPVRAGTRFCELNWYLDALTPHRLALATLGGGVPHAIAGAFATGTHGSTFHLPPPCDFVRAMRVIGARGRVWWVEPARNPITNEPGLRSSGMLDDVGEECVQVVYDDDLFDALLVSLGCGGIISDLVIETVDAHMMTRAVQEGYWAAARPDIERDIADIERDVINPPVDGLTPLWFYAFTVVSSGAVWIDREWLDSHALPPAGPGSMGGGLTSTDWWVLALAELLALLVALPAAIALIMGDIALELLELVASVLFPWEWDSIDDEWRDLEDSLAALGELAELAARTIDLVESASDLDDQVAALTAGMNLLWTLGVVPFFPEDHGLLAVDQILDTQTRDRMGMHKRGPERNFVMLADGDPPETAEQNWRQSLAGTLINSREFAVPAGDTLAFVDALMDGMARIREGGDAAIMVANIRFTRSTRATIGMQQFAPLTGHIEVYTAQGLDGTPAAEAMIDGVAAHFSAAPHWGQVHSPALAANAYAWRRSWADAMARLDPEGVGTFRRDFVAERGLY